MVDGVLILGFLLLFDLVCWKWGFWCIPSSVCCVVQPCRGLFVCRKKWHLWKHAIVHDFQFSFLYTITKFAINSRNHYQNQHPDPCIILVGTLNPWIGRPKVVPWAILFERVVSKHFNRRPYLLVCKQESTRNKWKHILWQNLQFCSDRENIQDCGYLCRELLCCFCWWLGWNVFFV